VKIFKQKVLSPKVYSKEIFFSQSSFKKDLQKFIKPILNWIQIPTPIHFASLCCHLGIFVPRTVPEIRILVSISLSFSLVYSIYQSAPPHVQRSHLHVKHSRCTYSSPCNQPISSASAIHHSFPSHSIEFKRSSIYYTC
jgi:hypothetical protein